MWFGHWMTRAKLILDQASLDNFRLELIGISSKAFKLFICPLGI